MGPLRELIDDDDAAGRFRVDRRVYADPELFARERARIFARCWLYLAHASELPRPGDFLSRTVAGRPLLVVRGRDDVVRAFFNTCTHHGATLCPQSSGSAHVFRCPFHSWTFDSHGLLRGVPGRASYGDDLAGRGFDLRPVRLDGYRDFLFVTLDPDAVDLVTYLAGAREYLDLVVDQALGAGLEVVPGSQRYGIAANWKLLAENGIDSYHTLSLHRRYFDYLAGQGLRLTRPHGRGLALGNGHGATESAPPVAGRPVACWGPPMPLAMKAPIAALQRRLADAYGDERGRRIGQTYRQLLIFPNLLVIDTVATTIRTWDPVAPDRMEVSAWALAPRDQPPDERALALRSFLTFFGPAGFATPDDIEILESCQRGLVNTEIRWADCSRGMAAAVPSFDDELQLRSFWRRWRDLVVEA
jgi:p-cumate 2,3-dioxygenase alpha subunit